MKGRGCFVTGTDTGVGKSVVASSIAAALTARGVRTAAFKPVVTGLDEATEGDWPHDHALLATVTGMSPEAVCPVRLGPAAAPPLAARLEGRELELGPIMSELARLQTWAEALVVEGIGGLLVPLTAGVSIRDFAVSLRLPVIVVARPGLGTLNHTLLTVESARGAGLDVRAVVLTPWPARPSVVERSNLETIARLTGIEVATLPRVAAPLPELLAAAGARLPYERWLGSERPDGDRIVTGRWRAGQSRPGGGWLEG